MSKITAKRKDGRTVSADINFATDLAGLVGQFGESTVYNYALGALTVGFQGWLRGQLDQKKTQEEVDAGAKAWKPGQRKAAMSPQEKLKKQFAEMSAEDRAALLKELRGSTK